MVTKTKIWGDFKRWCAARNLKALPAHPWTIASYLRWVERHKDAVTAREMLNVISREHLLKSARVPERHPTVRSTMELIERRAETRGLRSNLFDEDLLAAEQSAPAKPEQGSEPEPEATPKRRTLASSPRLKRRRPS